MFQYEEEIIPIDHTGLFRAYGHVIFAYLRLHTSSLEEAEDLTHEVFLAAMANQEIMTWIGPRQLGWLKRVATNKLIDSYRRTHRRPTIPIEQVVETLLDERDLEQMMLCNEDHMYLHQQIKLLPPIQQEALRLRYGYGLPIPEIAEFLKKSEQATRQILSRARYSHAPSANSGSCMKFSLPEKEREYEIQFTA